jgi:hypothetical protein
MMENNGIIVATSGGTEWTLLTNGHSVDKLEVRT